MSTPLHIVRGEAHTHRFESTIDDAPFAQLGRTLVFTLWRKWGRPGQAVVLTITTSDEDLDSRLVKLEDPEWEDEDPDPNTGKWELRLGSSDTLLDAPGMYKYTVWSTNDADPEDSKPLVLLSNLYITESGRED